MLAQIPGTPEQMQAEIATLRESVRNIQMGMGGARIHVPECPVRVTIRILVINHFLVHFYQVCFDTMVPPIHIYQCVNGHFVCGSCRPNIQASFLNNFYDKFLSFLPKAMLLQTCPTCRNNMVGRAHGTEEMLRASFS